MRKGNEVESKKIKYLFDDKFELEYTQPEINCEGCEAPCCKQFDIPLTYRESKCLPIDEKLADLVSIYQLKKEGGEPCPYLKENKCSIYERRPITCREYTCKGDDRIKPVYTARKQIETIITE